MRSLKLSKAYKFLLRIIRIRILRIVIKTLKSGVSWEIASWPKPFHCGDIDRKFVYVKVSQNFAVTKCQWPFKTMD